MDYSFLNGQKVSLVVEFTNTRRSYDLTGKVNVENGILSVKQESENYSHSISIQTDNITQFHSAKKNPRCNFVIYANARYPSVDETG